MKNGGRSAEKANKVEEGEGSNPQPLTNRSWKTGFLPNRGYTPGPGAAQTLRASPHSDQLMCNAHWLPQVSVPYYGYAFMF